MTVYSCRNITPQDFGPNDIANILRTVWEKDEPAPEAAAATTEDTAESGEDITEQAAENTTEPSTDDTGASQNFATVIDVRTVFPDVPEKLRGIPFPEAVRMTDSLKKNMKNLADYSPTDFAGTYFYIMTVEGGAQIFKPSYNGKMLNDARRYRTNLVDTECNSVTVTLENPRETILNDIKLAVQSGKFAADIVCVPLDIQSELIRLGLVTNLKKIPFLNPNAEYFNSSATESFTVNGNIYGLVSDLTFDPSDIYAVFYNKSLIRDYNLSSPLEAYETGGWNYNKMLEVSKELAAAIADLNHDTRWGIGIDSENPDIINGLFMSSGNKYFTQRDYSYPVLNFGGEKTRRFIETLSDIFHPRDDNTENFLTSDEWTQNKAFSNGNVLFSVLKLDIIPEISDSQFDWGILPVPVTESGEDTVYSSFTDNNALGISVLSNARNTEACGIITSALSLASHDYLKETYEREQMLYNLRDVNSVKILGDILKNINFSQYNAFPTIPEVYGSTAGILTEASNKRGEFTDLYESNRKILNDFFKTSRIFERN